jgi:hypothetical protein
MRSPVLTVIEKYSRECLTIKADRNLKSFDVIEILADLLISIGRPDFIRSDNGPEFTAIILRDWLARQGRCSLY